MAEGGIDKIDDYTEMLQMLKILDIPQRGLQGLDEMKEKAKEKIRQINEEQGNSNNWTKGFSVISTEKDRDAQMRQKLQKLYSETKSCLDKMDDRVLSVLNSEIPNIKATIEERQRRLQLREYYLLVAGESSAGKSRFLNLILGEMVLPSAVLNTTSTICELKYAKERSLVAHFKTKDPETGLPIKRIILKKPEDCGGKSYSEQIAPYVHLKGDRKSGSTYKKVEIFWPHELLQKGIVIIDSPGIGESDVMDKTLMDYLPKAFAFIYVINSENAGGMQNDRIMRIFEEVRKRETDEEQRCLAECALFICNKWDQIPNKERNEVKKHMVDKLHKSWPDVDPESQIVYLSTKDAITANNYEIVLPQFSQLMKCIRSMVLKAILARLHSHWAWLDRVLQRMSQKTRVFICNAVDDRRSVVNKMDFITVRIQEIQKKQHKVENDLKIELSSKVKHTTSELSRHLQTEHFKTSFATWTENDAPREERDWGLTKREITKAIEHRFGKLLQKWEDDHHLIANAHCSLVKEFLQRFNLIEEELQKIEGDFVGDNQENDFQRVIEGERDIPTSVKVFAGVTCPLWIPLGVAGLLIGIPVAGVIAAKKKINENVRLRGYQENRCAYLEKKSKKYLDSFADNKLSEYVKNQMKETESILKEYLERIPKLIEADKKLVLELNNENRTKADVQMLYHPILLKISEVRKRLTEFAFSIHLPSINKNDLDWKEDSESFLGKGDFSTVYKATLKKSQPVAIKLLKESLDPANVRIFCKEEKILRNLKHAHVVKLYGTASVSEERMAFVMELCQRNLKNAIFNKKTAAPAQNKEAIDRFFIWTTQIADGLKYIHSHGLYHRHLSLENILVSQDGTLKISDVGIRAETLMTERRIVYCAPEVIKSKSYNASADIYSLALILWEMWYGEEVFSELERPLNIPQFIHNIDRGYRPHRPRSVLVNLPKLQTILEMCWNSSTECRPTACECYIKLECLYQEWSESLSKGEDA